MNRYNAIVEVIPCVKLPRSAGVFDYAVGDVPANELTCGRIVNIPFKGKTIKGVVVKKKDKSDFENIKSILSIDETLPAISAWQQELIYWFSTYYHYSLSSTLSLFMPVPPKKKINVKLPPTHYPLTTPCYDSDDKIKRLAQNIFKERGKKKYLFFPYQAQKDYAFYCEMAMSAVSKNKQTLILFPRKDELTEFYQCLPEKLRATSIIFSPGSSLSKNEYFRRWREIKNGQKKLILGTRSSVFALFHDLGLIIVCESHSEDYKQYDQTPRYEAINVVKKIQKTTNCVLILSSESPRIEDAFNARIEGYSLISLGRRQFCPIHVVNLMEESKKKFTYLSEFLIEKIRMALSLNKKAFLIVNKKGEFSHNFCADCCFEAICPECGLPYVFENEKLKCFHCQSIKNALEVCPKCGGANFKRVGVGIQSVSNELKRLFGTRVSVGDDENCQIVLAPDMQNVPSRIFNNVSLLGFVYVDGLVHLADFNSNYKLYSAVKSLTYHFYSTCPTGEVFVQTFFPECAAFKYLADDFKDFFDAEIEARRAYRYPPFSILLKLIFQHHDAGVAEREAKELHEKLISKFKGEKIQISEPYRHYVQRVRKRFRLQIAVFLPFDLKIEQALIKEVPDYWIIDKNPIDLL
ncbi:hypothetical protein HZB94_02700 [Candidatus Falkowbacteria bacterium]|nr:hypothetical protein [Candidatus Falkowbacteria bacterium]